MLHGRPGFNADETVLLIRQMNLCDANGLQRLTLNYSNITQPCHSVNAKGNFKCKTLMVYRAPYPQKLKKKSLNHMTVPHMHNKKVWMIITNILGLFHNCSSKKVECYLQCKNLASKVLLILVRAPVHCH